MSEIILNADGTSIWTDPHEKLEAVKSALTPHLQRIKTKWEYNENSQYPRQLSFNSQLATRLSLIFHRFPIVPSKYAIDIDIDTLKDYVDCFYELVEYIMDYYEDFMVTKVFFCEWLGIDAWTYNQLLLSPNPDILAQINFVEEGIINNTLMASQTGKAKEKSTEVRLRANNFGHNINIKPAIDEKPQIQVVAYDLDSVQRAISGFGLNMKSIENKKK